MKTQVHYLLTKKKNTSHILHLILTLLTVGLWVLPWILIALVNSTNNASIDRKVERLLQSKEGQQ